MFYCSETFKNTYFEGHLRTATSELALESNCLELAFKTILTRWYYKNTSRFQTGALNTIQRIYRVYI